MCSRFGPSLHGVTFSSRFYQELWNQHHCSRRNLTILSQSNQHIEDEINRRPLSSHCYSVVSTDDKALFKCKHDLRGSHFQNSSLKPHLTSLLRFSSYHQGRNINFWSNPSGTFSCASFKRFSTRATVIEAMSTLHLAAGSECPPLQDGKVRLYSMKYCPFAQRALLVAEAIGIPYEIVNVNLHNKPEWMFQKNPEGLVPIIETKDGKVLYESLVVADYLDAAYATKPLHPRDPYLKGIDKILIEKFSNTVVKEFYKVIFAIRDSLPEDEMKERIAALVHSLKPFEEELAKRGKCFFGGDSPGMLDYMIWPWFERLPAIKNKLPQLFDYEEAKLQNPNLETWRQGMKKDPVVSKILLSPELHLKFMESFLAGSPQYDV